MKGKQDMSRKATVMLEDIKEQVLTYLDTHQRTKSIWFSCDQIRRNVKHSFEITKKALYELAVEGFLHIRHEPEAETRLLYRLRREDYRLTEAVRSFKEDDSDTQPYTVIGMGMHITTGTPDYEVECNFCKSSAVTMRSSFIRKDSDYPTIIWHCHTCGKEFQTADARDIERAKDLTEGEYRFDDE